jgi:hypothetical protein
MKSNLKYLLFLFVFTSFSNFYCQKFKNIKSIKQAEEYVDLYQENRPKILTDIIPIDSLSFHLKKIKKNEIKILSIDSSFSIRTKFIFFVLSKIDKDSLIKNKDTIISLLESGADFDELAKKYTMQEDKTCDTKWIDKNVIISGYAEEVKKHNIGDIFTFEDVMHQYYLITLKTHNHKNTFRIRYITKEKSN